MIRPKPRDLSDVINECQAFARTCRDRPARRRDLEFETTPAGTRALKVLRPGDEAGGVLEQARITTRCLRRIAGHFKIPYDYLAKYPIREELTEHLTIICRSKSGRRIVRMVSRDGEIYLRGLMHADKTPVDTGMLLAAIGGLVTQLPDYAGVEVLSLPEADGSKNRGRIIIPFGEPVSETPPLRAMIEIINDECDVISVGIGLIEAGGNKMGVLGHVTRRMTKEGAAVAIVRRAIKHVQSAVKQAISLKGMLTEGSGILPLSPQELAQILAATRTFPGGFAERVALYHQDDCRTVLGAFATLLDAAEGLPEQARRTAQKRAWALFVTGFKAVLHFKARKTPPGAYLVQT